MYQLVFLSQIRENSSCSASLPTHSTVSLKITLAIVTGGQRYHFVVEICIFMSNGARHLFTCFSAICISSVVKCLFKSLVHLKTGLLPYFCYWIYRILYVLWRLDLSMWCAKAFPFAIENITGATVNFMRSPEHCGSAGWASSHKPKVEGSIPGEGTSLGCRFGPWSGRVWEATDRCFSLALMCLSLLFSLPSL